jgi:hypothetical protein
VDTHAPSVTTRTCALKHVLLRPGIPTIRQRTIHHCRPARICRQLQREAVLAANVPAAVLVAVAHVVAGALPTHDLVGVDAQAVVEVAGPGPAGDVLDDGAVEVVRAALGEYGGGEGEDCEEGRRGGGELHNGSSEVRRVMRSSLWRCPSMQRSVV